MRLALILLGVKRLSLLVALAVSLLPGTVLGEPVAVRAASHEGFARIVFDWSDPVGYSAEIEGANLVILFDRPIEANYAATRRALSRYLSAPPEVSPMAVVFPLAAPFGLKTSTNGSSVVVDIVDAPGAAAQSPAQEGPVVRVRTGEHAAFSRIVFDWPLRINYRVREGDGTVTVAFATSGQLDLSRLASPVARHVSALEARPLNGGTEAVLRVSKAAQVKHFRSGTKVVLDIRPGDKPKQAAVQPEQKKITKPIEPKTPPKKVTAEPEAPAPAVAPVQPVMPAASVDAPVALVPSTEALIQPAGKAPDAAPASIQSPELLSKGEGGSKGEEGGEEAVKKTDENDAGSHVVVRFDWISPVAAAVFRRGNSLWAVFDQPKELDLALITKLGGNAFRSVEQIPSDRATLLKITTVAGINPEVSRDGFSWILNFSRRPLEPKTSIETKSQPNSPVGARLFLSVSEPGRVIAIRDPDFGDNLFVVPVIPLGHGLRHGYTYPQVRFLPSVQGIVGLPLGDTLRVRSLRQGLELTSSDLLHISPVSVEAEKSVLIQTKTAFLKPLTRLFDLEKWRRGDLQDFTKSKQRLQLVVARETGEKRERARMDLARFYFAHSFEAEAKAVLKMVELDRPEMVNKPEFRAMRGAINVLMGRFEDARPDLNHESLDGNDEGMFWRSVLRAYEGDLAGAANELTRTGAITRPYPKPLKMPLGTLIAEAAIATGDVTQAGHYLEVLNADDPTPYQKNQLDFVDGKLKELSGDFQTAIGIWEQVEEGTNRPVRARAILSRAELLFKIGKYEKKDMIEDLERLRFAWRGDDFEFNLLRKIGDFYLLEKDYREALRAYRQVTTYFRGHEKAGEVTHAMTNTFDSLYLENLSDELQPVTAIALYDEFRELTPPGPRGDEMIRNLADSLVKVDLLDRAARLLATQVNFRLKGEEKARVATRLALVYILARRYDDALEVLDTTKADGIPDVLQTQRRHLRARALIGEGKGADALLLLEDDENPDADLLRVRVYWDAQDWRNAGRVLRRVLREAGARIATPLDDAQAQVVLNLATAYTLAGNERALAKLRRGYGPAMALTPLKDAFSLIAAPESFGLIDYRTIAGKVKTVENFQSFMSSYKKRLKKGKLSEIN